MHACVTVAVGATRARVARTGVGADVGVADVGAALALMGPAALAFRIVDGYCKDAPPAAGPCVCVSGLRRERDIVEVRGVAGQNERSWGEGGVPAPRVSRHSTVTRDNTTGAHAMAHLIVSILGVGTATVRPFPPPVCRIRV